MSETRRGRVPRSVGTVFAKSLTNGHERVDHDDELRARLDRDVEVGGRDDAAVDQLAVVDLDRRVDHRQRVEARTAVEIGTSSQPSAPNTIRSQVSRSVAVR